MTRFVVDAYAWVEYLAGSKEGQQVKVRTENADNLIYTSAVTFAEVISKINREKKNWEVAYKAMTSLSKTVIVDEEMAISTGLLHAELRKKIPRFGLADAFVLQLARKIKAKILTGDKHFEGFGEAIMINQ